MNNITAERFNVAGAMLAKLFGRPRPRARRVRGAGRRACATSASRTAIYSRILFVALGLVAAVGTAIVYFVGGNLAISGTISSGTRRRVRRLRRADLPTARAAHELPRRRADRARVVRAGVRGARLPRRDHRPARRGRPRRPAGPRRARPRVVPPPARAARSRSSRWRHRARPAPTSRATGSCATSRSRSSRARPSRSSARRARARPRSRCSCRASTTRSQGAVRDRRPRRARPHARVGARRDRARAPGPAPLPRHASAPTCSSPRPTRPTPICDRRSRGARIWDLVDVTPRRSRHRRRRARLPHVGRREATPRDRAPAAEESRRS